MSRFSRWWARHRPERDRHGDPPASSDTGWRPGPNTIQTAAHDTWPPLTLRDGHGPLDLSSTARVLRSVDGGAFEFAEIVDAERGMVAMPDFAPGDHTVEYEIHWPDGKSMTVPTSPVLIRAVGEPEDYPEPEPDDARTKLFELRELLRSDRAEPASLLEDARLYLDEALKPTDELLKWVRRYLQVDGSMGVFDAMEKAAAFKKLQRLVGPEPLDVTDGFHQLYGPVTRHMQFSRCPECTHATVGMERPWTINHAWGCSAPVAVIEEKAP